MLYTCVQTRFPDHLLYVQAEAIALQSWHEELTRVCGRDILTIDLCD